MHRSHSPITVTTIVRWRPRTSHSVKDLLPCTQDGFAVGNWYRERWPEQRCLQMRMTVAIMPSLFVAIVAAGRDELVENSGQIMLKPWLELDCANRGCTADVKNVHCASTDPR